MVRYCNIEDVVTVINTNIESMVAATNNNIEVAV